MNDASTGAEAPTMSGAPSLASLFFSFLKIGSTAFGGFMALISVVQDYAVQRKKLLRHEDMLDGISLATILPGPVAVNVVAYVGYRVRGVAGALVSALGVILPSFLLLVALSYVYFRFGQMQSANKFFMGFIPAVAAVILTAAWNMGTKTVKGVPEAVLALVSMALLLGKGGFLVNVGIIFVSAIAGYYLFRTKIFPSPRKDDTVAEHVPGRNPAKTGSRGITNAMAFSFTTVGIQATPVIKLFGTFAGMSVLLFGGGYVFIPLIQQTVVDNYGWVTRQEFIDAIALGQVTPGPILISAAFIGYKVAGFSGASAATLGIFTPPALIMLLATRFMDKIKSSDGIKACMRGIRSAVIGMIAAAGVIVAFSAQQHLISLLIFVVTFIALVRFKIETAWVIPVAGLAGLLLY